ncbi:hypothetical protein KQI68_07020 [Peptoniphilus sp. MSJ-1]|uniref:Uncharacterized protein n=1 Tax=Peptoniphilus ovalis TaxID=2841503 RepID=A0ABS6FHV7_9FIRM|nr:hypothetical protein [Peptoniphilus ovalis]MBU5669589.1 hypothetical protein [Peptoniphilus ovalis]
MKLYGIEYDNGEPWEDGFNYTLNILFKSKNEAIDYIKHIGVEDDNRIETYSREKTSYSGETLYYLNRELNKDNYELYENDYYKVLEFELKD